MGKVVHVKSNVPGAVYVGRPSPFGNPFVIGVHGTRAEVIERYREWLIDRCFHDQAFRAQVAGLAGKTVACWCAPLPCHGSALLEVANALRGDDERRF